MSYTLNIWNPAATIAMVQGSLAEIADRLEKLAQVPASDADQVLFNKLAKRLWQHYPSADESDSADDIFEGNLPRDSLTVNNKLWTIGLLGGNRLRVLRDVAEHAKTIGLAVYDDQIGIGFDPRVGIIPRSRASDWEDVLRGLREPPAIKINKVYLLKHVIAPLNEKLIEMGFKISKRQGSYDDCVRHLDQVDQRFSYFFSVYADRVELHTSVTSLIPKLVYLSKVISEGKGGGGVSFSTSAYRCGDVGEKFSLPSEINTYLDVFDTYMVPVIERTQTIKDIDQLIYSPEGKKLLPPNFYLFNNTPRLDDTFVRCGIAGLAGNPMFEEIVLRQREMFNDDTNEWHPKMRGWLMDLIQYFKDPVAFERESATQQPIDVSKIT